MQHIYRRICSILKQIAIFVVVCIPVGIHAFLNPEESRFSEPALPFHNTCPYDTVPFESAFKRLLTSVQTRHALSQHTHTHTRTHTRRWWALLSLLILLLPWQSEARGIPWVTEWPEAISTATATPTLAFRDNPIHATPGTTVEVCLTLSQPIPYNLPLPIAFSNGGNSPHFSDYPLFMQYTFPANTTLFCFDLHASNEQVAATYGLYVGETNIETELIVSLPQTDGYCGVVPSRGTPADAYDVVATDVFGNSYTRAQIRMPESVPTASFGGGDDCGCGDINTGFFNLTFEDCLYDPGFGFAHPTEGPARRQVACEVFAYLSGLITPNESICNPDDPRPVNVQIQPSRALNSGPYTGEDALPAFPEGVLGYASPFYPGTYGFNPGIHHSVVETILQSGEYPNQGIAEEYHGLIRINFEFNYFASSTQEIDESTAEDPIHDLYTVMLHEATHMMGFTSAFSGGSGSMDGEPSVYTPFDQYLKIEGNDEGQLIVNDMSITEFPRSPIWRFNIAEVNPITDLHQNCENGGPGQNIRFRDDSGPLIYARETFREGTSFNHLAGKCRGNNIEYVMNPSLPRSTARRTLLTDELTVLRAIGYEVEGTGCSAGTAPDNPAVCPTMNVYQETICPPEQAVVRISLTDILENDPGENQVAYMVTLNGGNGNLIENGQTFEFTASRPGIFQIAYATFGCDGRLNNWSTILVEVSISNDSDCLYYCPDQLICEDFEIPEDWNCFSLSNYNNTCNLICNGGFDGTYAQANPALTLPGTDYVRFANVFNVQNNFSLNYTPGWFMVSGTPEFVFEANFDPEFMLTNSAGVIAASGSENMPNREEFMTFIPVLSGTRYFFSFEADNYSNNRESSNDFRVAARLIMGQDLEPGGPGLPRLNSRYFGPRQDLFSSGQVESNNEWRRYGEYFIADNNYSALLFTEILALNDDGFQSSRTVLDNVEIIEDNFSAGPDRISTICGQQHTLGGEDFCMLSDVGVRYDWYQVDDNGETVGDPLHSYTVLNGELTAGTGTTFSVAPNRNTTYRLVRTIVDRGGLPEDFNFCHTDSEGNEVCTTSDDLTITVLQSLPVADFTFEETVDCGIYNFFSDPSTTGNEHEWFFVINGIEEWFSDEVNPMGIALADGNHTIVHRVSGDCGTTEAIVAINGVDCNNCPTPTVDFTWTQDCTGGFVNFTTAQTGGTHAWTFDDQTSTAPNPSFDHPGPAGFYQVTYTFTNDCDESNTRTETIELDMCDPPQGLTCPCEGPNALNIDAGAGTSFQEIEELMDWVSFSFFWGNTLDLSGRCLNISGRLLIDDFLFWGSGSTVDLRILNGAIRMEPGSEIVVVDQGDLWLQGVNEEVVPGGVERGIHGCDFMWEGIDVQTGGTLQMNDTYIQDALNAVHVFENGELGVANCHFENNFGGIRIRPRPELTQGEDAQAIRLRPNGISGNHFSTLPEGLKGAIGGRPAAGSLGSYGIGAELIQFVQVGQPGDLSSANHFDNLFNGVIVDRSAMAVYQSNFTDLRLGALMRRNAFGIFLNNSFEDMESGIDASSSSILATQNVMTDIREFGILNEGNTAPELLVFLIDNNHITARDGCINLEVGNGAYNLIVRENTLELAAPDQFTESLDRAAIRLNQTGSNNQIWTTGRIVSNPNITVNGYGVGIDLFNANALEVSYNNITFQQEQLIQNGAYDGIRLTNAPNNFLYTNTITAAGAFGELACIRLDGSSNNRVCCNTTDGGNVGVSFFGTCDFTALRNTTIGSHNFGLQCGMGTITGPQVHAGNQWNGSYGVVGAQHLGDDGNIQRSLFTVAPGLLPPSISIPNAPGATWFDPADGFTPACTDNQNTACLPVPQPDPPGGKENDEKIASGDYVDGDYAMVHYWEAGLDLFSRLDNNESLRNSDPTLLQYYNQANTGAIGAYVRWQEDLQTLLSLTDTEKHDADSYWANIQSELAKLDSLRQAYAAATTAADSTNIEAAYLSQYGKVGAAFGDWQQLSATVRTRINTGAASLLADNATLPTDILPAANHKLVNDIQLSQLLSDTLTGQQQADLENLAFACPLLAGNAVYRAQSILRTLVSDSDQSVGGDYVFDNEAACDPIQALQMDGEGTDITLDQRMIESENRAVSDWRIYPNPTKGQIWIEGSKEASLAKIQLYDRLGRIILTALGGANNKQELELPADLSAGIYFLVLEQVDGSRQTRKLIIEP